MKKQVRTLVRFIALAATAILITNCASGDGSVDASSTARDASNPSDTSQSQTAASQSQTQTLTLTSLQTLPLTCTFHVAGSPDSIAVFDPVANTVTTTTGSPAANQVFSNITILTGQQPYGDNGITFVAFGDAPLFSVSLVTSTSGTNCGGQGHKYHQSGGDNDGDDQDDDHVCNGQTIVATWNLAPGGPQNVLNAGTCQITQGSTTPPPNNCAGDGQHHDNGGDGTWHHHKHQ